MTCKFCKIPLTHGVAMMPESERISRLVDGVAWHKIVWKSMSDCLKCQRCGYSVTV